MVRPMADHVWIAVGSEGIIAVRADAIRDCWAETKFGKHWVRVKLSDGGIYSVYPSFPAIDEAEQRANQIRRVMQ